MSRKMNTSITNLDADQANDPMYGSSGERLDDPSAQPANAADRVVAVCPGCQATLRVRRVYIGGHVCCKNCGNVFPILAPADSQTKPAENGGHAQLLEEHGRLMAARGQFQSQPVQLEVENGRLTTAQDQLGEALSSVTTEPNAIQTSSGARLGDPTAQPSNRADRIVAVCPGCQAALNVRRAYIGSDVQCKNCKHIFPIAAPADSQSKPVEDGRHAQLLEEHGRLKAAYAQLQSQHDQLAVESTRLATAKNELGEQLNKELGRVKTAFALLQSQHDQLAVENTRLATAKNELGEQLNEELGRVKTAFALLQSQHDKLAVENTRLATAKNELAEHLNEELGRLKAVYAQVQSQHDQLQVENTRLATAKNQLGEQLSGATNELSAIRAELGGLAPAEVRSLAEERETIRTEVQRLRDENRHLSIDLDTARSERLDLTREQQTATDEINALQTALAERDSALRYQSDQLGAQVESHRQAFDHARHAHGTMIESLEAQLAALGERFGRLDDEHRSTLELCKQFQARDIELTEAQQRLESVHQSVLDAERMKQAELAEQLMELRAGSEQEARLAEQLISASSRKDEERSPLDAELAAARAQIEELNWLLAESERLNREMGEVLNGLGVRFNVPVSNRRSDTRISDRSRA
jgi:DNA repair exonuclease SbcCD ATPase subunit